MSRDEMAGFVEGLVLAVATIRVAWAIIASVHDSVTPGILAGPLVLAIVTVCIRSRMKDSADG